MPATRRLAAILAADVAGYSRLIGADEQGTLDRLRSIRAEIIQPKIAEHRGRLVKTTGDGFLVEFASVVDALHCATEVQQTMGQRNSSAQDVDRIDFRIGVHQGDIVVEDGDIFGDGVNVAARLEGLAEPGGICVSARVNEDAAGKLDLTFRDIGEQQLKNITRRVRVFAIDPVSARPSTRDQSASPVPRLSVVVLPFANLSPDPEQEYFVNAITDDLTTDLSRVADSFVIARSTAFAYKGKAIDVRQVARELGVRYVLEGSVRRLGDRLQVNVQLIDGESGSHIWADRFDTDRRDLVEAQSEIVALLARTLNAELIRDIGRRIEQEHAIDPHARDVVMRARAIQVQMSAADAAARPIIVDLLERAIVLDPDSVDGRIQLANLLVSDVADALSSSIEQHIERAEQLISEALERDPNRSFGHQVMGHLRRVQGRWAESQVELETAIELDPNNSAAIRQLGLTVLAQGEPEAAIPYFEKAIRLEVRARYLFNAYCNLGRCRLFLGQTDEAVSLFRKARTLAPGIWYVHLELAGALGLRGDIEEAKTEIIGAVNLKPEINSIARWRATSQTQGFGHPQFQALRDKTAHAGLCRAAFPRNKRREGAPYTWPNW
jgi:adenylate cyclase